MYTFTYVYTHTQACPPPPPTHTHTSTHLYIHYNTSLTKYICFLLLLSHIHTKYYIHTNRHTYRHTYRHTNIHTREIERTQHKQINHRLEKEGERETERENITGKTNEPPAQRKGWCVCVRAFWCSVRNAEVDGAKSGGKGQTQTMEASKQKLPHSVTPGLKIDASADPPNARTMSGPALSPLPSPPSHPLPPFPSPLIMTAGGDSCECDDATHSHSHSHHTHTPHFAGNKSWTEQQEAGIVPVHVE